MNPKYAKLRLFVRIDGFGNVVKNSMVLRATQPKSGRWLEINKSLCCVPITVESLTVVANPTSIAVGATSTITVTATMSDGSTVDATADASYTAVDPAILTVADNIATGVSAGAGEVAVAYKGKNTSVVITVTAA